MKRKIVYITGTRADYGLMRPVLAAIQKSKSLEIGLIVTGMHLSREFGYSVDEIKKDSFRIYAMLDCLHKEDTGKAMVKSIGNLIAALADEVEKIKPDFLMVLGDRGEMLAGAIVGAHLNIPVVHIHGGEVSGNVDEFVRHAISKFAHIHFVATEKSKIRLLKMGEQPFRITVTGAPALDNILNIKFDIKNTAKKFNISQKEPLLIVIQHPVTTETDEAGKQITETLKAIKELGMQTILIYPNADAGGRRMISVIEKYNYPFMKKFKSLAPDDYLSLLSMASVLIGNSSSGIIEAPSFHLPVVNIGTRQNRREKAGNVIDVIYSAKEIVHAIKKALYNKKFLSQVKSCNNPYGDGHAASRIVAVLEKTKIDKKLLQKQMTY